jgi:hypothetical protein
MNTKQNTAESDAGRQSKLDACQSIDWYSEGESRTVEIDGVQMTVRFVGRKGRRGRIAVTAPPGATFRALDFSEKLPIQIR